MKLFRSRTLGVCLGGLGIALLFQCAVFNNAGALLVSEQDEAKLGAQFDSQLRSTDSGRAEFPVFNANTPQKQAFQSYVENLGQSILASVPGKKPSYPFKFTLIDKDIDNAFAVPGGYVYIYTGIIKHMQDESELAGVLGHEITHVVNHHYRDALAKDEALSLVVQGLAGNSNQLAQIVAQSLFQLAALKVSRGNEYEADEYGTRFEANTGHNPEGIAKFFKRMKNQGITILSTHPQPSDRVSRVESEIRRDPRLASLAADSAHTDYKARFDAATCGVLRACP